MRDFQTYKGEAAGNFKICGAMLVYASEGVRRMLKRGPGWNFVSEQMGLRIMRETNELVLAGRIKPVIGRLANFDELPAAIEDLAGRKTIGRTIVRLW